MRRTDYGQKDRKEGDVKIGELANHVGVNIQTVRYYERRGLLPEPERTESGYREYDEHDIHRMEFILRAKDLGAREDRRHGVQDP